MSSTDKDIKKQIDAYVKGQLSEDEILSLWAEFAQNPTLLEDLELEVGLKKIIEEAASEGTTSTTANAPITSLPVWTWHAAAAAVLILIAFVQLLGEAPKTELEQFVVNTVPADQIETADGIRSKEMVLTEADSLLNLGFSALVSGNNTQALSIYNEVIDKYDVEPYGSKAFLNKGILLYNTAEYDSSISAFENALSRVEDSRMIQEKAYWYLANAFINTGQLEEARTAVINTYSLDGVFRKPAFLLYKKLNYDLGKVDYEDFESQQGN